MYERKKLDQLANKHKTDKGSMHHDYCRYYEPYIEEFRHQSINLIEMGVGGDEDENVGGHSLRMWEEYFSKAKIIGVDVHKKNGIMNKRTKFYQISQDDKQQLESMVKTEGVPSIIIDDASHINPLTIETFKIMFPLLSSGGIYIVEDLETSYWNDNGYKGNPNPKKGETIMQFLKELTDSPNSHCFSQVYHNIFSKDIDFIHFFKQTCVIKKR